jgi:transcriptional regulator with XRE-family HTH domain
MPKTRIIEADTIGGRLRAARESKKLTLEKIGEHLGVSAQAVSQWEYGETQPSLDKLCMLVQLLEVQLDVVVGMRGSRGAVAELTARLEQVLEVLPTARSAIIDLSTDRATADGVYLVRLRKGDRSNTVLGRLVWPKI